MLFNHKVTILVFYFMMGTVNAQNITGTWQGEMQGEFLQLNIRQRGNELCGYTYDYELDNKKSHCIAAFEGAYDSKRQRWFLIGRNFIENSGTHVFMRIILWGELENVSKFIFAKVYTQSGTSSTYDTDGEIVTLKKVSSNPKEIKAMLPSCFNEPLLPALKQPLTPNNVPPPEEPISTPQKATFRKGPLKSIRSKPDMPIARPVPTLKADSVKRNFSLLSPERALNSDDDLQQKMSSRKKSEQIRITVNAQQLFIKVFDNGIVDGDTVSIFYNGKLLLGHQKLSDRPIELNLSLDEKTPIHEITLYADNLGQIPPNTALVIISDGNKRFELHSKANLSENAVLVLEYKKK